MKRLQFILGLIPNVKDIIVQIEDACLDAVEEIIQRTDNQVDDHIALPVVKGLRKMLNVPEFEETEGEE